MASRYRFAAIPQVVTKVYRTSDLSSTSLERSNLDSPDYSRARVAAYALIAQHDERAQWVRLHSEHVRGLCLALGLHGRSAVAMARQQFRFGVSTKSVAFFIASLIGRRGLVVWNLMRGIRRSTNSTHQNVFTQTARKQA